MIEKLVEYIKHKIDYTLSDTEIEIMAELFRPKKLRKRQYFIQSGDICRTAGFIVKGSMKKYTVDDTGKENILELFIENWWASDKESFMIGTPTPYYIEACEDTELLVITKEDFNAKIHLLPYYADFSRALTDKQSFQLMKRLHASQTYTAEQKLEDLHNTYPEFLQRFPQHIIASYLGMTKETLSRIRSNALKK